eukprot:gene5737-25811_t
MEPAAGSNNICRGCASAAAYQQSWSDNLKRLPAAMIAASPKLLLQCDLAEYIHCSEAACNLQNRDDFAEGKACAVGSMSKWGADTCVPDVNEILDNVMSCPIEGIPGTWCVSHEGAAGLAAVISSLKRHAAGKGYGPSFYGPQAACGLPLANGLALRIL